jgi:two-component system, NtrC family, sensor kinase
MKKFIISLLLFLLVVAEAQPQQNKLDSLHSALQNAANDTIRMDVLNGLGSYYYNSNIDSLEFYLERSLSVAQKLNLRLYEAGILGAQAGHYAWSNYPKALELSLQALKIAEDPASEKNTWNLAAGHTPHIERLNTLGWIYFQIAQLYGNTDNIEKQTSSLKQAINIAQSLGDSVMNMLANLNLGNVYLDKLKKLDSALYFEQRALSLFSKSGSGDKDDIGWVFGSIGAIYFEKENFDLSREAFQKGLQLMQEQNNLAGVGSLCLSLSKFYKTTNKPDSSLLYAYKALETYNTFKDKSGIANAYSSLSSAYDKQKRSDSAFAYLKSATALHDSLNNIERKNLLAYQNGSFVEQMRVKNLEDEKIQTRTKIRTYAMLAGIAAFMAIAFLLYRNNRHRKKANELLQKQKDEIAEQKENIEQTLVELKSAQAQLIQSEKMASLGELTAGIAHEIQNPLNFVNNFSEVNTELIDEMQQELKAGHGDEAITISNNIKENQEKINHHGKRADAIVKGMLQHSRSSSGVKEPTDINALADEYLRLAYHGLRAKDKSFNATMKTDYAKMIGNINIIPQDIGRVILNLITNAFYAVAEKKKHSSNGYEPTVSVSTKMFIPPSGGARGVEIRVADNGNGIPQKVLDKIFQPFFTTKPTGQGTGLGLSLSYDIVKAHGGELKVETKEGEGSEFIIQLPVTINSIN